MKKEVSESVRECLEGLNEKARAIAPVGKVLNEKEYMEFLLSLCKGDDKDDGSDRTLVKDGKMGVADAHGNVLVPPMYKECSCLNSGMFSGRLPVAACDFDDKYALVACDGKGTPLCGFEYDMITCLSGSDNLFVCKKDIGSSVYSGVLNSKGELLVPCEMDIVHFVANDVACVVKDGKLGILTMDGNFFPPVYDDMEECNGYLTACKDGVWGYVSTEGEFIALDDYERLSQVELFVLVES